jgi:NADPH2:quinone reductase
LKAAVLPAVDAPFELRDVLDPVPQDGEALVRVRAAGINFLDVLIRRGRYPQMPDFPAVLGVELAGELEEGTRVMAIVPAGGYAELAAVPRASLVPLPDGASFAEGAGFLLTFLTAWVPLTRQVRLEEGHTVLVHAAAGGVGTATIQVAKALGARVVAAVGSPGKLEVCRELGAEEAYVYDELPDDLRVDVVADPVGGSCSRPRSRGYGRSARSLRSATRAACGRSCSRRSSWDGTSACRASTSAGSSATHRT